MPQFFELSTMQMLQDGMDGATARQDAISNNMANVNTPGYKRREVSFKDSLKQAYMDEGNDGTKLEMNRVHDRHFKMNTSEPVKPSVHEVNDTNMRNDKNNVDPDKEMAKQAKNSLHFNGMAQFERKVFSDLNNLIGQLQRS